MLSLLRIVYLFLVSFCIMRIEAPHWAVLCMEDMILYMCSILL